MKLLHKMNNWAIWELERADEKTPCEKGTCENKTKFAYGNISSYFPTTKTESHHHSQCCLLHAIERIQRFHTNWASMKDPERIAEWNPGNEKILLILQEYAKNHPELLDELL